MRLAHGDEHHVAGGERTLIVPALRRSLNSASSRLGGSESVRESRSYLFVEAAADALDLLRLALSTQVAVRHATG